MDAFKNFEIEFKKIQNDTEHRQIIINKILEKTYLEEQEYKRIGFNKYNQKMYDSLLDKEPTISKQFLIDSNKLANAYQILVNKDNACLMTTISYNLNYKKNFKDNKLFIETNNGDLLVGLKVSCDCKYNIIIANQTVATNINVKKDIYQSVWPDYIGIPLIPMSWNEVYLEFIDFESDKNYVDIVRLLYDDPMRRALLFESYSTLCEDDSTEKWVFSMGETIKRVPLSEKQNYFDLSNVKLSKKRKQLDDISIVSKKQKQLDDISIVSK